MHRVAVETPHVPHDLDYETPRDQSGWHERWPARLALSAGLFALVNVAVVAFASDVFGAIRFFVFTAAGPGLSALLVPLFVRPRWMNLLWAVLFLGVMIIIATINLYYAAAVGASV